MATEKTYYTIDPEGKLTCMKCKVPLKKGNAKFMYLDNGFPGTAGVSEMRLRLCSRGTGSWQGAFRGESPGG